MVTELSFAQAHVQQVDPHQLTDVGDLLNIRDAEFESLTRLNQSLRLEPLLATEWSANRNATEWVFRLRDRVRFHNGQQLKAQDVAYSIRRMAGSQAGEFGNAGAYAVYLQPLEVIAPDASTVVIQSPTPISELPELLVDVPIVREDQDRLVGTGQYSRLRARQGFLIATAFSDHWRGQPRFDQVRWHAEPNPAQRLAMVENGQVDIATSIPPSMPISAQWERKGPSATCLMLMLAADRPPFNNRDWRIAANLAVDTGALIEGVSHGHAHSMDSPVTAAHMGHDGVYREPTYDPEGARALATSPATSNAIALSSPIALPAEASTISRTVADCLIDVGIRTEVLLVEDRPTYSTMVMERTAGEACFFDSTPASTYRVLREKISSTYRGRWWYGYSNATVELLLRDAERTVDSADRAQLYSECLAELRADPPWIYLYSPDERVAVGRRVGDWIPPPDARVRLDDIPLE